jgi:uncharacterized lipoprotein YajG
MKTSIKLSALFFLLSAGVFATNAAQAKDNTDLTPKAKATVTFDVLGNDRGFKANIAKSESGKTIVRFYNSDKQLLLKDNVNTKTDVEKGYVLSELECGDYTLEIASDNKVVKKAVHVYMDGDQKSFFIAQ